MELLLKHFPNLKPKQVKQFELMISLYEEWNQKVNVISRKDTEHILEKHILHSLALAKYKHFKNGSWTLDLGTGGGFPGLPLAIMFPKANFHLVDSIGKKIMVVNEIAETLGLKNVKVEKERVENLEGSYHYIVSRAVAKTTQLLEWTKHLALRNNTEYLFLKGGDLTEELKPLGFKASIQNISQYYKTEFYETKKIVWIKH
ncbi:MAG: 16S rRNA (guanine(527)-N(7))-methyltransferase RsmG [Chitinophagales bacterium]